jgi:hypothetical protein
MQATDDPMKYTVSATVTLKNLGNTPAYIEQVRKELYLANGDNTSTPIGNPNTETSPNYDPLGSKEDALPLPYDGEFKASDFVGDRSVIYRLEVIWHDAFGEAQKPAMFCQMLLTREHPDSGGPIETTACPKGMTFSTGSGK